MKVSAVAPGVMAVLVVAGTAAPTVQVSTGPPSIDTVAEGYVKLVLAVGQHDADYVDAFYGPGAWKEEAASAKAPLDLLKTRAAGLVDQIERVGGKGRDDLVELRQRHLRRQLDAVAARLRMLSGGKVTFDEESRALYDAVAPLLPEAHYQKILARLEGLLPGSGPLVDRYEAFQREFVIPPPRIRTVFNEAIAACRARTLQHVDLPAGEAFTVEYVTGKSWSAYNWYRGGFRSLIQVNTDLPIYVHRAVDLACHEGYPGHHVYNALLEKHLVRDRGWIEFSVYPLFSPQSLIAEGTADFGVEVVFPGDDRMQFEKEVIFPLSGLDPTRADEYYRVHELVEELDYAENEAARRYLDGMADRAAAVEWLMRYALMPRQRAEQRVRFFDQYRSYVINYNLGEDLVRRYIERRGGSARRPDRRWEEFVRLLSFPRLPSGLD
jgi:hypothetical protein